MKTKLNITGMSCEHCVKHVTEALKGVAGVKSAAVSLKTQSVELEHDDAVTLETLNAALVEAGYGTA
jgi:copper chaperone CopZ